MSRRCFLACPQIVRNAVVRRFVVQPLGGQPERWLHMPRASRDVAADQTKRSQVSRFRQIETGEHIAAGEIARRAGARLPLGRHDERR